MTETMEAAVSRLATRITPETIIDVGASSGTWSGLAYEYWPNARYLMLEPLEYEFQAAEIPSDQVIFLHAAAGHPGVVHLNITHDRWGSGVYGRDWRNTKIVPSVSIDDVVRHNHLRPPYLMKFDIHGFEVPALEHARHVLEQTVAIVMEVYLYPISPTSLALPQMCEYLGHKGFGLADLVCPFRANGVDLSQMDAVFVKSGPTAQSWYNGGCITDW